MKEIPNKSIDLILCDLPYGVTQNKKDIIINLKELWKQYNRIIKDKGIIILTSQFPFTIDLILSQRNMFRYDLIWNKQLTTGFLNAKRMPLRTHEHILIYYKKLGTYNPQFTEGEPLHSKGHSYIQKELKNQNYGKFNHTGDLRKGTIKKYPKSIINIQKPHPSTALHRTEKPVKLAEWLIKTYSNEKDVVLDNCIGTGWTALACLNTNRNFIGIELDKEYVEVARKRLKELEK
jgi:site-specific DNA-methyltransferase (adenine-specific)